LRSSIQALPPPPFLKTSPKSSGNRRKPRDTLPSEGRPCSLLFACSRQKVWGTRTGKITAMVVKAALANPGNHQDGNRLFPESWECCCSFLPSAISARWQLQASCRALSQLGFQSKIEAMSAGQILHNGKPQAFTAGILPLRTA